MRSTGLATNGRRRDPDLEDFQRLDGDLVRQVAYRFKQNRTCAEDHLVTEMIVALGEDTFDTLAIFSSCDC